MQNGGHVDRVSWSTWPGVYCTCTIGTIYGQIWGHFDSVADRVSWILQTTAGKFPNIVLSNFFIIIKLSLRLCCILTRMHVKLDLTIIDSKNPLHCCELLYQLCKNNGKSAKHLQYTVCTIPYLSRDLHSIDILLETFCLDFKANKLETFPTWRTQLSGSETWMSPSLSSKN